MKVLASRIRVLVPECGERGEYLRPLAADGAVRWNDVRTAEPIKRLLFPPRDAVTEEPANAERTVVLGVKACDLASLAVLDTVFRDGPFPDPRYIARRAGLTIIASDCTAILPVCSCALVGIVPRPRDGFDLCLSRDPYGGDDRILVEIGSEEGERLLEEMGLATEPATPADAEARERARDGMRARAEEAAAPYRRERSYEEIVRAHLDDGAWDEAAARCVECGACSYICPTCHCYILTDLSDPEAFRKVRKWDSCLYAGYARVAGGANPRARRAERLQNRFACKFCHLKDAFGVLGCTGCGRCIEACQGGLDLRIALGGLNGDGKDAGAGGTAPEGR
ncbi:MAG: 4Fe-4S dicluster domain-containing protein [Planctomycetes bacterium]|nr:4Fe-4S dicluster domain-containing protein [Planctomycetota bacterium]